MGLSPINQGRRNDLVSIIMSQSVVVDRSRMSLLDDMKAWCRENVGEQRPYHPLGEAEEGWLDYFDGEWAITHDPNSTGWIFWFGKKADRTLFQLTWL